MTALLLLSPQPHQTNPQIICTYVIPDSLIIYKSAHGILRTYVRIRTKKSCGRQQH